MSSEAAVASANANESGKYQPLSVLFPILLVGLIVLCRFIPSLWEDGPSMTWAIGAFGPVLASLLVLVWWLAFSRATAVERVVGLGLVIATLASTIKLLDETVMPLAVVITIPLGVAGFAIGLIMTSQWLSFRRTLVGALACLAFSGLSDLVRNEGAWGDFSFDLHWRWSPTPEERFLAERAEGKKSEPAELNVTEGEFPEASWSGFRGSNRDGVVENSRIDADWEANPPEEKWRFKVGPAWSSFAVAGEMLFTQEQRGEQESAVCYSAENGQEIWANAIESRFTEALGGLGPRATPTLSGDKLVSQGAAGWLRCNDARTGELLWKVDIKQVADCSIPMWGFSCSPLCVETEQGDLTIVHTGAAGDKGIMAFSMSDGSVAWSVPAGKQSYGSLQDVQLLGKRAIAILSERGAEFLEPETGVSIFLYDWKHTGYRALQPLMIGDDRMLIPTGMGSGTRLVQLAKDKDGAISGKEVWTSRRLKPDFNDILVHEDNLFGFDGEIFCSLKLADGKLNWKGGRYGKGQAILLADAGVIIVLSEKGDLVLLKATPDGHKELYRAPALEGRTWNHPVLIGNQLYLRNDKEAVCYTLPIAP